MCMHMHMCMYMCMFRVCHRLGTGCVCRAQRARVITLCQTYLRYNYCACVTVALLAVSNFRCVIPLCVLYACFGLSAALRPACVHGPSRSGVLAYM
jgi:hypothetical protein